jgi:hypothetical protein
VRATPWSINVAPNNKYFAMTGSDRKIRIFSFLTGKLHRVYDESDKVFLALQQVPLPTSLRHSTEPVYHDFRLMLFVLLDGG